MCILLITKKIMVIFYIGSEDTSETTVPPAPESAENENSNSSSSEDRRPLLSRMEVGTKRKAEVLSKESGKIGVTITTSPTSSSPPPAKVNENGFIFHFF